MIFLLPICNKKNKLFKNINGCFLYRINHIWELLTCWFIISAFSLTELSSVESFLSDLRAAANPAPNEDRVVVLLK